jgi:hypothetical protein
MLFFEVQKCQQKKMKIFWIKKGKWDKGSKIFWQIKSDQRQYLGTV